MQILNDTKKIVLSDQTIKAKTLREKTTGLIGAKPNASMIFQTRFGIHTFGMRFAIDVLILNSTNHVIKVKSNLKPNRLFFWNPKYDIVIELPAGIIDLTKTEFGDHLKFEFEN